jgi:hypothetical protein
VAKYSLDWLFEATFGDFMCRPCGLQGRTNDRA